jgi:hypothetical protein
LVKKAGGAGSGFGSLGHSTFLDQAEEKRGNGQDQKDEEECLGNADSPGSNAAKAKQGGNQGDDEKYNSVVQHGSFLVKKRWGL